MKTNLPSNDGNDEKWQNIRTRRFKKSDQFMYEKFN